MSFNLREYIKQGFLDAVGKMADYQIILNSAGYHEKNVLTEEDLAEINEKIKAQYAVEDESVEETIEDIYGENVENNAEQNTENSAEPEEVIEETEKTVDEILSEEPLE